ncbi:MAG: PAS domain-containing protein, partial [Chloroflexota bacterium]
ASDIIGRNSRFLQGDDREQESLVVIRHAIANGLSCQVVLRNYRADGTLFWNELRISPIQDKGGDITHYVGIQEDVSDRYTLIRDLQEMSMLRSSLFEQTNDAVFLLDV